MFMIVYRHGAPSLNCQVVPVPVQKHVHVPQVTTVERHVEVPQVQYMDQDWRGIFQASEGLVVFEMKLTLAFGCQRQDLEVPVPVHRHVPVVSKVTKHVEVPVKETVEKVIEVPVVNQVDIPQVPWPKLQWTFSVFLSCLVDLNSTEALYTVGVFLYSL